MKKMMIAALVAAQLPAAAVAAPTAEPPGEEAATQQLGEAGGSTRLDGVELAQADAQAPAEPQAAQPDKPKKRKSTGDKILTGAAVVLGVGALAVGALLVAIFVN